MPDINVNKLSEILNTKADIDLNNTGVFSTSSGGVNLVQSTPSDAKGREVASADFSLKQGGLELMDVVFAPLGIDESKNKRRYLNGQVLIQSQFPAFTAAVKARMATMANAFTTETNWQAEKTNSKLGQCGKFVVDDTAGTIRLPCVVNAQGLTDLSLIGAIKSESLPNISGLFIGENKYLQGCFNTTTTYSSKDGLTSDSSSPARGEIQLDASRSSSTYQNNAPVQQEAVQYPYCIVVNTGVDEAERPINNYQVNNVYSYGMSQYYKGIMNNNSWLKSVGQWNDGTVYTGMYNWLLEQMNAGVSGFVASTATYTDYDFVINTADQTFRLPLKNGQEGVFADGVKGNGITIGLTNGTNTANLNGMLLGNVVSYLGTDNKYGQGIGIQGSGSWYNSGYGSTLGLTTDSSKSGIIVDKTVPSGYNLYYYIGDTLQNAQLINVARIEEKLTSVNAASRGYVVESYHNGTEWYRIYSDGWIEQGGVVSSPATDLSKSVSLLKVFTDTNYSLLVTENGTTINNQTSGSLTCLKRVSSFQLYNNGYGYSGHTVNWFACGY